MATPPSPTERLPNPWWIPPFLGTVPIGIEPRHLGLLGPVALAMFFENYDMSSGRSQGRSASGPCPRSSWCRSQTGSGDGACSWFQWSGSASARS
jgi:hypothetical protein